MVLDPQILTDSIELGKVQLATGLERSSPKCASDGIRVDLRRQDTSDVAEPQTSPDLAATKSSRRS